MPSRYVLCMECRERWGKFCVSTLMYVLTVQVGDWVMSIGSPKSPGPSVILGIVSGLTKTAAEVGRPETQVSFIQTDASFDSGVVGGPLVNEYGEVVGINSIGMTTSSTVQFSVPINQVKSAITDLANGKVNNE